MKLLDSLQSKTGTVIESPVVRDDSTPRTGNNATPDAIDLEPQDEMTQPSTHESSTPENNEPTAPAGADHSDETLSEKPPPTDDVENGRVDISDTPHEPEIEAPIATGGDIATEGAVNEEPSQSHTEDPDAVTEATPAHGAEDLTQDAIDWDVDDVDESTYMDADESLSREDASSIHPHTRRTRKASKSWHGDELLYQKEVGISALGKRVDALILRNPNKMRSSRVDVPIIERDQPSVPFDLHNVVGDTQELENNDMQDEVFRNIEELRPSDTTVLRTSQFEELRDALMSGFTGAQLRSYLQAQPKAAVEDIAPYSWVLRRFDYIGEMKDKSEQEKAGSKQAAVLRILLRAWHLETQDEHDMVSKMSFILRDDAWWLLNRESSRSYLYFCPWLLTTEVEPGSTLSKTIRQDFLGHSPKESFVIAETGAGKALILRTRRATVSAILARIDDAIKSIVSSTISGYMHKAIPSGEWSESHLQSLGDYTQTMITKFPSSSVCSTICSRHVAIASGMEAIANR